MSDDLAASAASPASPPAYPGGGFTQPSPGAAPVPIGAYAPVPPAPYPTAGYPAAATRPPAPVRPRTLGVTALVAAIAAVVVSIALSATTGFAAASGAMHHAAGISPEGLEHLTEQQLLQLLSPVRGLVLWAEIGYWTGTVLGLAALALGITAIATRRGRGFGIAAVATAAAGPIVYALVVGAFIVAGIAAGAS